jgi:hypothetical protein
MKIQIPEPAFCVVCGAPGASPREGHRLALCHECEQAWLHSPERARAATARADFVRIRRAERKQPAPKRVPVEDDPWSGR